MYTIQYHIGCIYNLMCIYGLTRIRYHIFCVYIISHVLMISHVLTEFRSSNLLHDVTPCGSNSIYLSLYSLIWPCTTYKAFSIWNLSTVPGVTPTVSNYHNTPPKPNGIANSKPGDATAAANTRGVGAYS